MNFKCYVSDIAMEIILDHPYVKLPEIWRGMYRTIRPPTVRENLCKLVHLKSILVDVAEIAKERNRRMLELQEEKSKREKLYYCEIEFKREQFK